MTTTERKFTAEFELSDCDGKRYSLADISIEGKDRNGRFFCDSFCSEISWNLVGGPRSLDHFAEVARIIEGRLCFHGLVMSDATSITCISFFKAAP